jgi:hypothetical protein
MGNPLTHGGFLLLLSTLTVSLETSVVKKTSFLLEAAADFDIIPGI